MRKMLFRLLPVALPFIIKRMRNRNQAPRA
jgi:hypothetical protein